MNGFVIAWYVNGVVDEYDAFLVDMYPTWGPRENALVFSTEEEARRAVEWWNDYHPADTKHMYAARVLPTSQEDQEAAERLYFEDLAR